MRRKNNADPHSELIPVPTAVEKTLDVAAVLTSVVPWIGGPVAAVLSGASLGRKMDRVEEVLSALAEELRDVRDQTSKDYVQTDEFEDLLEETLKRVASERSENKRRIYASFLGGEIKSPGASYDEQIRILKTLEDIQPDHLRVLAAVAMDPEGGSGIAGSPSQTLKARLPDMDGSRISDLVAQLNDLRILNLTSLNVTMTFDGAQRLQGTITPFGNRFLGFLRA